MQSRINRFLLAYALLVSTLCGGALVTQAIGAQSKTAFDEIDVKRINVREDDGTLRMVISNTQRFPGVIVKGSIEYAVAELGVPLILVLGHSQCGAVKAALQHLDAKDKLPGAIAGLVDAIKPAVAAAKGKPGDPLDNAIRANVLAGVARLKTLTPIVAPAIKQGKVKMVGGVYDLKSGAVTMIG